MISKLNALTIGKFSIQRMVPGKFQLQKFMDNEETFLRDNDLDIKYMRSHKGLSMS